MEIVPILSTIILVGTVATFILAVAAYILYKMREGGGNVLNESASEQVQPHHVVMPADYASMMGQRGDSGPSEASTYFAPTATTPPGSAYVEAMNGYGAEPSELNGFTGRHALPGEHAQSMSLDAFFWEYTDEGFSPVHLDPREEDDSRAEELRRPDRGASDYLDSDFLDNDYLDSRQSDSE